MLLTFGRLAACPAHVVKTNSALNMRAATLNFADPYLATGIWAEFCALFEVQIGKHRLVSLVFGLYAVGGRFKFIHEV